MGQLHVFGASEAVVYVSADTDYLNKYPDYRTGETAQELDASVEKAVDKASKKGYEKVKKEHIKDYSEIFSRVQLDLGQNVPEKTTDILLNDYNAGKNTEAENRALEVILFQYGRYLTIASFQSRRFAFELTGSMAKSCRRSQQNSMGIRLSHECQLADELLAYLFY